MLPVPAIRSSRTRRSLSDLARALDRYSLWAFNPPRGRR